METKIVKRASVLLCFVSLLQGCFLHSRTVDYDWDHAICQYTDGAQLMVKTRASCPWTTFGAFNNPHVAVLHCASADRSENSMACMYGN